MSARHLDLAHRYGPWAIVTGATDGIGLSFAHSLAALKLNVVLVARRASALKIVSDQLTATFGVACSTVALDLAEPGAVEQLVQETAALDVGLLVAAAGFGTSGDFLTSSLEEELDMVTVNCAAVLAQSWHFGRRFAQRGSGGIVLLSSLLAACGTPGASNYAATKAYIQNLAEGLRQEFKHVGVDVLAVAPGPVRSGFANRANMRMSIAQRPDVVARESLAALGRTTTIRPGSLSKLLGWSAASAPRTLRIHILGRIMSGMTAHHRQKTASIIS
jgi:uncharacterized protein